MISITEQYDYAKRDLAYKRLQCPVWIKSNKLTPDAAMRLLATQEAIVATLDKMVGLEEVSLTMRGEWPKPKPEELFG
jgi:hypothetical protein